jgi:hypothetical protein
VQRDYADAPDPDVLLFNPTSGSLTDLKQKIDTLSSSSPRIVLQADRAYSPTAVSEKYVDPQTLRRNSPESTETIKQRSSAWARDSVGLYPEPFSTEVKRYGELYSVKGIRDEPLANDVLQHMRNCMGIFTKHKGTRTCFQICD